MLGLGKMVRSEGQDSGIEKAYFYSCLVVYVGVGPARVDPGSFSLSTLPRDLCLESLVGFGSDFRGRTEAVLIVWLAL